jgi:hypothetical protein
VSDAGGFPPIGDYGLVGDCRTAALVSRGGSIDWMCVPRFDGGSCFGRLLDRDRAGHCTIAPVEEAAEAFQRYLPGTLVLETTFRASGGEVRLVDCLAASEDGLDGLPLEPGPLLVRVVEGVRGAVELGAHIAPRFDYGDVQPQVRRAAPDRHHVLGGDDGLAVGGDLPLELKGRHDLTARFIVRAGERARLYVRFRRPAPLEEQELPGLDGEALDALVEHTIEAWRV